jgi:hypothetical protein
VLQMIIGGFRRGPFCRTPEERLRQFIHHEMLRMRGLSWPPYDRNGRGGGWWSKDKKQQADNRRIYHGLRIGSLHVINTLIGKALEEAADADAVKAARRFVFSHREPIYRAGALSRRALQLTETFPVLALAIYCDCELSRHDPLAAKLPIECPDWGVQWKAQQARFAARKQAAVDLVERGVRLRDVAATMNIPMALRCIKPGAAHLATDILLQHPELLRFMPETLMRSRDWLRLVNWAHRKVSADYAEWVARNAPHIPGRHLQIGSMLSDLADWVRARHQQARGHQYVVRPFTPSMSLKTVTKLSADWHEAVAHDMSGPQFDFPTPWYPAAKIGDYEILPIETSGALYLEGSRMHHCVGNYADDVRYGVMYVYSIRHNGDRLATLALGRTVSNKASLIQIRGPCNAEPPKEIITAVQRWVRAQAPLPPRQEVKMPWERQP